MWRSIWTHRWMCVATCISVVIGIHATDGGCCLRGGNASTVVGDGNLKIGSRVPRRSSKGIVAVRQLLALASDGLLLTGRGALSVKSAILLPASILLRSVSAVALPVLLVTGYTGVDASTSRICLCRSLLFRSLANASVLDKGASFMVRAVGGSPSLLQGWLGPTHADPSASIDDALCSTAAVSSRCSSLRRTGVELLPKLDRPSGATTAGHGAAVLHDDVFESHVELVVVHACLASAVCGLAWRRAVLGEQACWRGNPGPKYIGQSAMSALQMAMLDRIPRACERARHAIWLGSGG